MTSLCAAANGGDAALDLALLRIGILAPADLGEIRALLVRQGTTLRPTVNRDGHRVVELLERGVLVAQIHHDGRVFRSAATAA